MTKYRFDYFIAVPVVGGSWHQRHGSKQMMGHSVLDAARKLYQALSRKWVMPPKVEIDGGIILKPEGFVPINPDILPNLNANLFMARQVAMAELAK